MLSYPSRWKYDVLCALVYLVDAKLPYDSKLEDALRLIRNKKRADGTWPVQAKHPGEVHIDMENMGSPSRMNTMRVIKVLEYFSTKNA